MKTKRHGDITSRQLVTKLRASLPFYDATFGEGCTNAELAVLEAIDFLECLEERLIDMRDSVGGQLQSVADQLRNDTNIDPAFRASLGSDSVKP